MIRSAVGVLIVALLTGSLMAIGGVPFPTLPTITQWAIAVGAFVVGVAGAQLVAEAIQRRKLKHIRSVCRQRYQMPPTA